MKPLKDYSFVKGVNYGMPKDDTITLRDLGYAKRLGINSVRIWLSYHEYPDGTVRDPAIAAAIVGCFRCRDIDVIVPEKANREREVNKALAKLDEFLSDSETDVFSYRSKKAEDLLEICEHLANLLECSQLTAMQIPPTARVAYLRAQEKPRMLEIKQLAYELAVDLKKGCQIL
jgi:hypothetical protein